MNRILLALLFCSAAACTAGASTDDNGDLTASESRRSGRADRVLVAPNADGTCNPGFEIEVEHGVVWCKSHGSSSSSSSSGSSSSGASSSSSSSSGNTSSSSGAVGTFACQVNADCPLGQECEIEVEHGVTTAFCKDHGGRGGRR